MTRLFEFVPLLAAKKDAAGEKDVGARNAQELMDSAAFHYQLGLTLACVGIGIVVLGVILMVVRDARKKKQRKAEQEAGPPSAGPDA
jgi:hypothetical protein